MRPDDFNQPFPRVHVLNYQETYMPCNGTLRMTILMAGKGYDISIYSVFSSECAGYSETNIVSQHRSRRCSLTADQNEVHTVALIQF